MRASIVLVMVVVMSMAASLGKGRLSAGQAQTPPASAASSAPAGNAENGKTLYVSRGCYQCHGFAAQGGGIAGARLAGRLPAWAAFEKYLRRPTDQMIPYTEKVLPGNEAADIYAWLRSIPPPPSVASIPLLSQN